MSSQRPLILHVIHHLMMGGMENGLVNLINTMPESAYRHAVICIEDFDAFRERITRRDVEVVPLFRSRIGIWRLRKRIYEVCRQMSPTVVHSRNMSGLDALLPARLAGVAHCVHGEHGWDVDNLDGTRWKPALLRRLNSPFVERFVTVSKDLEQFLTRRVGISSARISQIYNGVDTARFSPAGEAARSIEGLPPALRGTDQLLIGAVGRIQPVKDHETLIRAFAQVLQSQPALRGRLSLVIAGDGPLLRDMRQLAESLAVQERIWLPGAIRNVPDLMRGLDVFVLPSLREGISNTLLEAMASGLPVLATGVGGNVELVEDGRCGRLFAPRDVTTLARLLLEYASNPRLRREQGAEARRICLERFSLAAMVEQYTTLYDRLCLARAPALEEPL
jgi:sugar transferase (PEP-CTERM/EpsH1 system associated)